MRSATADHSRTPGKQHGIRDRQQRSAAIRPSPRADGTAVKNGSTGADRSTARRTFDTIDTASAPEPSDTGFNLKAQREHRHEAEDTGVLPNTPL